MLAYIYLQENDGSQGKLLAIVRLEVVPGGTYVIDGVPYVLADKPTFHISPLPHMLGGLRITHELTSVMLLVSEKKE